MTENDIKEELSNSYIKIIAANKGYMLDKPSRDYGVDFIVSRTITFPMNGGTRILKDNKYIDIQLKATTESKIAIDGANQCIKYTLEVKNYNDLVRRKSTENLTPLVLILYILPDERNDWVGINHNEILLRKKAYWYLPPDGSVVSDNITSVTISIPQANVLSVDCFDDFYQNFYY